MVKFSIVRDWVACFGITIARPLDGEYSQIDLGRAESAVVVHFDRMSGIPDSLGVP